MLTAYTNPGLGDECRGSTQHAERAIEPCSHVRFHENRANNRLYPRPAGAFARVDCGDTWYTSVSPVALTLLGPEVRRQANSPRRRGLARDQRAARSAAAVSFTDPLESGICHKKSLTPSPTRLSFGGRNSLSRSLANLAMTSVRNVATCSFCIES